jgi:hypothetical protein
MYIAYISDEIWIFYAFEIVSKKASVYFQPWFPYFIFFTQWNAKREFHVRLTKCHVMVNFAKLGVITWYTEKSRYKILYNIQTPSPARVHLVAFWKTGVFILIIKIFVLFSLILFPHVLPRLCACKQHQTNENRVLSRYLKIKLCHFAHRSRKFCFEAAKIRYFK